ncbi:MAG: T9SS type A sorting domain-containing protein [Ignavibacteria bacterium]|jgi:hypothetical protein|nr:T9SS type A sorting domain-containing protein [Ignavibacteria bacterium]
MRLLTKLFTLNFLFLLCSLSLLADNKDKIILTDPTGKMIRGIVDTNPLPQFHYIETKYNVYSQDQYFPQLNFKQKQKLKNNSFLGNSFNTLATFKNSNFLFPSEYFAIKINTDSKELAYYRIDFKLSNKCEQAMNIAPKWIRNDLLIKFRELRNIQEGYDALYAQLILDAAKEDVRFVDEVAFLVAHIAVESLTTPAFRNGDYKNLLADVRHIYTVVDSLKYVRIKEHGSYESGDYYTTTEYRHKVNKNSQAIWTEIPYDIYYWYVVHPQIHQELLQYKDNPSYTTQRTWGYSWRNFYWSNPDANHDYTPVNQKTKVGEVKEIPRLGDLMQKPEILFDRDYNLLLFNRPFNEKVNTALNVLGNWCSRAIPGDPVDNNFRPIAPNQVLTYHLGRCGEDTQLLVAAARTCLIPIITRITHCEDHVFGAVYDADRWQHFEFFRGGLVVSGWGWTHLDHNGVYEELAPDYWIISTVNGERPDGFAINHTEGYTKTCELVFNVRDTNGLPVDGAKINLHGVPYAFGDKFNSIQYTYSRSEYTDKNGNARILAGDDKIYLYKIYHKNFVNGQYPPDSLSFNIAVGRVYAGELTGPKSQAGKVYEQNLVINTCKIPTYNITQVNTIEKTKYAIEVDMKANDILIARNSGRTFHYWNEDSSGYLQYFIVDRNNFDKLQNGKPFEVYSEFNYQENGKLQIPIPETNTEWFLVCSNKLSTMHAQYLEFEANLLEGEFSYSDIETDFNSHCSISPNPFNSVCNISVPSDAQLVEIIDINGKVLFSTTETEFTWEPKQTDNAAYFLRTKFNNRYYINKFIYNK